MSPTVPCDRQSEQSVYVVDAIQTDLLLTHDGTRGLCDEDVLESAPARPERTSLLHAERGHRHACRSLRLRTRPQPPLQTAAGKRASFVVTAVSLGLNGLEFTASEADKAKTIVALASGELDQETPADGIRLRTAERPSGVPLAS